MPREKNKLETHLDRICARATSKDLRGIWKSAGEKEIGKARWDPGQVVREVRKLAEAVARSVDSGRETEEKSLPSRGRNSLVRLSVKGLSPSCEEKGKSGTTTKRGKKREE